MLLSGCGLSFKTHMVFNFICHKEPRSIDLLHSLRCLQETRVADLLVFHLADIYGTSLIDIHAQGTTNAFFNALSNDALISTYFINPTAIYRLANMGLICFPKSVISQYVPFIVNNKCGSQAANLVRNYYFQFRAQFNHPLDEILGPTNICHKQGHNNITGDGAFMEPGNREKGSLLILFHQILEHRSPGTAMNTVYGRSLRNSIKQFSFQEFCNPVAALSLSFQAYALLSYDASNKGIFNVLHNAHSMYLPYTDIPGPSSIGTFSYCWNKVVL